MTELELLAPAKNLECGIAAVDHGADAVYIGPERFGARVAAGNSVDDIRQLCAYAHQYGVKVFATVNTLLHADELEPARQLIWQLYEAGVDAVLVQDMALLAEQLPPIALHASTQTDNRTAERVRQLREAGFRRVVLARELSVSEIAAIHEAVPDMPLEVFVHGALCVSYSGRCNISEHCFGRSANRGACAQVCRMAFDLLDADGEVIEKDRYLLSLKDLNQMAHLQELVDAGATSFKIEGRLKDVAYVKNVTAAYSEALNAIVSRHPGEYRRASRGRCRYTFTPRLEKTFNRGFTNYFLHGRQPDIFSPDTPKAMGEYVGTVKEIRGRSLTVAGTARFANGDGLCYIYINNVRARKLEGFRVNRAEGNRLFPQQMPATLRPGMRLWRNNDMEFERVLSRPSSERKIPVTMRLSATPTGFRLTADGAEATIDCPHQTAEKPQRDNIVRQLSKLGGTPYECEGVELADGFSFFVPSSQLAELRRRLVEAMGLIRPMSPISPISPIRPMGLIGPMGGDAAPGEPLMQCRHCLRYSLGYCVRRGGRRPSWHEPLFLRMGDGRRFRLAFDCNHCQMNVYGED